MVDFLDYLFLFGFNAHSVVPDLFALQFGLKCLNRLIAVLFFTYNMLVKRHSSFLALDSFNAICVMVNLGLLSVNPSGVETISASRISMNCC